jgi:hypothetical protein
MAKTSAHAEHLRWATRHKSCDFDSPAPCLSRSSALRPRLATGVPFRFVLLDLKCR